VFFGFRNEGERKIKNKNDIVRKGGKKKENRAVGRFYF
jgi:hypothetical protein